ncbi:beta-ketoacyl synthase N-terminal-like domain-containing protein [Streptomyces sp. P17]|uniref:beta-ketoacyl-[acyl-carrier-protein] synthase family protein n=1 Tax=Streptomyces sp. P17 TaxID=3074716 RepID=UPI0028F44A66|nr:beta-ketoacyl synthase N-terminal-like domain-containing protein [Streptomyces sp. P17]MDT9701440.1 beta-ketoacyl synthase N-terminal-like domain-containing protein [Streptomyces sp. P17]
MKSEVEVLVTGIGAVTCHGAGADTLWGAMRAAGVRLPDRPADPLARMELPLISLVPDPDLTAERATRFASLAAREALADAGLDADALADGRTAVVLGSCMGEPGGNERGRGPEGGWAPPFRLAAALAAELGVYGTVHDLGNACAAGAYALGVAADLVRAGEADVVIAGGSDAYSRVALGCFNRLGAVDAERCRPFERDRAGTVFAEGAGVLVVESAEHARLRGAAAGAVRLGAVAWSCDADHPTAPGADGEQIVRAMRQAVGPVAESVGCVVPHGTGTRLNDVLESRALHRVLGPGASRVPLYSLKALLGHAGGASAALGAVAAALILRHGEIPPNVPLRDQDPECEVLLPQGAPLPLAAQARRVLVNAYGFGGNNASVVLEGVTGDERDAA